MPRYPSSILKLIAQFSRLPGIGLKTAERLALHLASAPKSDVEEFRRALDEVASRLTTCQTCGALAESNPCPICGSAARDRRLLCVVAKHQDMLAIERTGDFSGRYHLLGGTVNPLEGVTLEQLRGQDLVERIGREGVQEVVLAFNPDVAGEGTVLALKNLLQPLVSSKQLRITKLARGLPLGADVEYADEMTLSYALKGRREA